MVISFSNDTAFAQLVNEGCVVTYRKNRRKKQMEETWANRGRGEPKEFDVRIMEIGEINNGFGLEPYVELSGFHDDTRWKVAIRALNNGDIPETGYLYMVVKDD